jgi:hypothetical protein
MGAAAVRVSSASACRERVDATSYGETSPKRTCEACTREGGGFARRSWMIAASLVLLVSGVAAPGRAFAQPDLSQMSGVPLPVADLPSGTVTVRVVLESLTNPVSGHSVQLVGAGIERTAATNDAGRAEFAGLPSGARLRARTTVAGEALASREFEVPSTGGIRVMLVAGLDRTSVADPPSQAPRAAAQPGTVSLGDQSRFVVELGDDGLSVFYIFQIVNRGTTPVQPPAPVSFDLPEDARGAAVLQGSSPQASVAGRRVEVTGPFAPGPTAVQVGYTMPYSGPNVTVEQTLPVPLAELTLIAQKVGEMAVHSRQIAQHRETPVQGQTYIVGRGPGIEAGGTVTLSFSGLPYHPTWPRNLALVLAIAILAGGAWTSLRQGGAGISETSRRKKLEGKRDRLFDELTALEIQHRGHTVTPEHYTERRRELVLALERVYAALDDQAVGGMSRAL